MVKFSVKLACEFVVKGNELVIRSRHILVPRPVLLMIVPLPGGGGIVGVSFMAFWAKVQTTLDGCWLATNSDVPGTIEIVIVPPL